MNHSSNVKVHLKTRSGNVNIDRWMDGQMDKVDHNKNCVSPRKEKIELNSLSKKSEVSYLYKIYLFIT